MPPPGPEQRQATASEASSEAPATNDSEPSSDEPAWAHHSQLDPLQLTPMLRHYVELKAAHPERVLLYRLGDFFECFFEDAIELSRVLELTLTGKEGGKAIGRVPMAGIPHHAAERYCAELIKQGYSVALCDQLETTPTKGALLKRDITPGADPRHGAGRGHAQRPPQQLAGGGGGGAGPGETTAALVPGQRRCEHR